MALRFTTTSTYQGSAGSNTNGSARCCSGRVLHLGVRSIYRFLSLILPPKNYRAAPLSDATPTCDPGGPRGEKYGVRDGRWKYLDGPAEGRRELFDLAEDPRERVDLVAERPEVASRLADALRAWRASHTSGPSEPAVGAEDRARLEALGYVE